jgi:glycosyltransferase involved in cell wall biosynthesis
MQAWRSIEAEAWPEAPSLHIAGEGPLARELDRWRDGLTHPELVIRHGFVEDIASFLAGLSLLVLPSRAEGFGLAAAEASACGVPVVATDCSSLPEVVLDQKTGLLIRPRDPDALADAIGRLLRDRDLAGRLGRAGREHIERRFGRETMLDALEGLVALER